MSRVRAFFGYGWAALMPAVVLATFLGFHAWPGVLAKTTGVKVSPWYTGGEVARTVAHDGYTTRIHEPVFGALIGERAVGFVQLRLEPTGGSLPAIIDELVDLDGDGANDVRLHLDTRARSLRVEALTARVAGESELIDLGEARVVRVPLENVR